MRHILVADDHEVTRRGVRETLRDAFEGLEISEAETSDEVLEMIDDHPWDVIVVDIMMPGGGILKLIERIRAANATVPILILTAVNEIEYVIQSLKAGANGLIHKHRAADDLVDAIEKVASGGTYLHADSANEVAGALRDPPVEAPHTLLSPRELEIFRLIALDRTIKEIAGDLGLSDKTVATYLGRIREKTGLGSYVEIARYALRHGVVD